MVERPTLPNWKSSIICGVLLGSALLTKIQSVLIPIPIILWTLWRWRTGGLLALGLWVRGGDHGIFQALALPLGCTRRTRAGISRSSDESSDDLRLVWASDFRISWYRGTIHSSFLD